MTFGMDLFLQKNIKLFSNIGKNQRDANKRSRKYV